MDVSFCLIISGFFVTLWSVLAGAAWVVVRALSEDMDESERSEGIDELEKELARFRHPTYGRHRL